MIVSASRRTDIPAFHAEWLVERLREGFVDVPNPRFPTRSSRVDLTPESVDAIVFWTKDFRPMLPRLGELRGIPFCVQHTLTSCGPAVEPRVPPLPERIEAFLATSESVGKDRVVWRYDPILIARDLGVDEHLRALDELVPLLAPRARRVVTSLLDRYPKADRRLAAVGGRPPSDGEARTILAHLARLCAAHGATVETCAEEGDWSDLGIAHGRCVDDRILSSLAGHPISATKDRSQRAACGCIRSVDIGTYGTCAHGCLYCYADR